MFAEEKVVRSFDEPLLHPVPITFLSFSSYLEPTGQVALNQAVYMLLWEQGLRLKSQQKHIIQRKAQEKKK